MTPASHDERLDIFDDKGECVGTATRREVHKRGYWHQTFHCWVCLETAERRYLLLQLRHPSKDTNPGKLDVSCAGHLLTGEGPKDGIRELEEELGIRANFESLEPVGIIRKSFSYGDILDNEICHIFLLHMPSPTKYFANPEKLNNVEQEKQEGLIKKTLSLYRPQLDEVSGLFLVVVEQLELLCRRQVDVVSIHGVSYDAEGRGVPESLDIDLSHLVSSDEPYYELLFEKLGVKEL